MTQQEMEARIENLERQVENLTVDCLLRGYAIKMLIGEELTEIEKHLFKTLGTPMGRGEN